MELPIRGGFTLLDAENVLDFLENLRSALEVAGGAHANRNLVLSRWLELEVVIERDHFVDTRQRHIQLLREGEGGVAGYVAEMILNVVKDENETAPFITPFVYDLGDDG